METKPRALRRRLFGVRTQDVQQLLVDRDATAVAAGEQVRAAEDRAKAFEARAASLEAQLAEATEAQGARRPEASDSTDPHTLLLAVREEMARVMHATQEAGSRILDFARSDVEHQLDDVERRRNEINGDRERINAWVAQFQDAAGGWAVTAGASPPAVWSAGAAVAGSAVRHASITTAVAAPSSRRKIMQNSFVEVPAASSRVLSK